MYKKLDKEIGDLALWRAKRLVRDKFTNKMWVEGFPYRQDPPPQCFVEVKEWAKWFILYPGPADWGMERGLSYLEVDVSTMSKYTGIKDKHKEMIFSNHIVEYIGADIESGLFLVENMGCYFRAVWLITKGMKEGLLYTDLKYLQCSAELKVVGNMFDNKDLLENPRMSNQEIEVGLLEKTEKEKMD